MSEQVFVRCGIGHDAVLDELTAFRPGSRGLESESGSRSREVLLLDASALDQWLVSASTGVSRPALSSTATLALPQGPRRHPERQSSLADLAIVAGFCGFGSSLKAARKSRLRDVFLRWPRVFRR
jgi:hypothetical protein